MVRCSEPSCSCLSKCPCDQPQAFIAIIELASCAGLTDTHTSSAMRVLTCLNNAQNCCCGGGECRQGPSCCAVASERKCYVRMHAVLRACGPV